MFNGLRHAYGVQLSFRLSGKDQILVSNGERHGIYQSDANRRSYYRNASSLMSRHKLVGQLVLVVANLSDSNFGGNEKKKGCLGST
jgi:hypothetical protein